MGVKDKSLWERFQYRYTYIGTVEREGKAYKKYEKIPRFKNPKRAFNLALILLLLVVISAFVMYLMNVAGDTIFPGRS